jgi:hypothetical protein
MSFPRVPALLTMLAALAFAGPVAAAGPQAALIETKASGVVSLKITVKLTGSIGERSFDQERTLTSSGVVVDPAGLVMITADSVSFRPRGGRQPNMDIKVTPTSIRVTFPGDEKEYDAILGATDTKLGLAYVLIRDLEGRKAHSLDAGKTVEPALGDTLYAVTRLGQGFDYAPICQAAHVIGQVTKPRPMWTLDGEAPEAGHPLYDAAGALAGIMISQEGVGEGAQTHTFLLPLKVAQSSIALSLKAAQKELEDVKTREAEAAAKAKEAEAEKAAEPPSEKPDGEKPDGEKPAEKPPEPAPAPTPGAGK